MQTACALFLCFLMALPGCLSEGAPSAAQKLDQVIGAALVYDSSLHDQAAKEQFFVSALTSLGISMEALEAAPPSATGMALAAKMVEKHPELALYQDLIAKLYSLAMNGVAPAAPLAPPPAAPAVVPAAPAPVTGV